MATISDDKVLTKWKEYPVDILPKLRKLRELIIATADRNGIDIHETLKWNEPSYTSKKGSTIRIGWSPKRPLEYGLYFTCSTNLVETFKYVHGNTFSYEKNRAIIFKGNQRVPKRATTDCILMALQYHSLKHLPFLGR